MPLDPQIRDARDRWYADPTPPLYEMSLRQARAADLAAIQAGGGPVRPVESVRELRIPGPATELPARLYRPDLPGLLPVLVYFFGGGWTLGNLDTCDGVCRDLCVEAGCLVLSVEYRTAPEHPFPAAPEDCYRAVEWLAQQATALGGDPARIAVAGDSAGGNLAAVVAQLARDRGGPALTCQALVYPNTAYRAETPSMRENTDRAFFNRDSVAWYWSHYLSDPADGESPMASPLRAADLHGLPPALVLTAEYDPLRDEAEAYAARLREAGVPVELTRYDGMVHGFFTMSGTLEASRKAVAQVAGYLATAFTRVDSMTGEDGKPGGGMTGQDGKLAEIQRLRMLGILAGTWLAQGCSVLARLGIPDLLAAGPRGAAELARAAGADPVALARLLGALASAGILREPSPGLFALTPAAEFLRADQPGSLRGTAILYGEEVYRSFGGLLETVRTGTPAFEGVHGLPFYSYLAAHPETADTFNSAMAGQRVPPVLSGTALEGVGTVVDVGGGDGGLLADLLTRQPSLRGVLLELPDAARQARRRFEQAGVADRAEIVEGSFFDGVPGGGDLYVLSRVLHNWSDANAARILDRLYAAMRPGSRLVVLEGLLPEPGEGRPAGRRADESRTRMVDLLMLVMLEGRDRTATEYQKLLVAAGFQPYGVTGPVADGAAAEGALEAHRP